MLTLHIVFSILAIIFVSTVVVLSMPWCSLIKTMLPIVLVAAFKTPSGAVFFAIFAMAVFWFLKSHLQNN